MSFVIRRYQPGDRQSVEDLNRRLERAGIGHRVYPESDTEQSIRDGNTVPRFTRLLVAANDDGVHGGVWLTTQGLYIGGALDRAGWIKYPVSESLIDPAYRGVPAALVLQMMREEPTILSLGLGGHHTPFARLLAGLKWTGSTIPFYFRIQHPSTVLRELRFARGVRWRRTVMDVLAWSGAGWLGHRLFTTVRSVFTKPPLDEVQVVPVETFGSWADDLWHEHRSRYGMASTRNAETLNDLYQQDFVGLTRMRVRRSGKDIGWICTTLMDLRQGEGHRHFGKMLVGTIADCFGPPEEAHSIMAAGARQLVEAGADLLVSNQGHPAWGESLRNLGFLTGPSNLAFYRPPSIDQHLQEEADGGRFWHITRGDGDGPRWA